MIGFEVVAEERKLESAAALERTMTGPPVATQSSKQWNDMPLEVGDFVRFGVGKANFERIGDDWAGLRHCSPWHLRVRPERVLWRSQSNTQRQLQHKRAVQAW